MGSQKFRRIGATYLTRAKTTMSPTKQVRGDILTRLDATDQVALHVKLAALKKSGHATAFLGRQALLAVFHAAHCFCIGTIIDDEAIAIGHLYGRHRLRVHFVGLTDDPVQMQDIGRYRINFIGGH